jgi:hypothetical protein
MEATLSADYSVSWDRRCSQAIYPPRNAALQQDFSRQAQVNALPRALEPRRAFRGTPDSSSGHASSVWGTGSQK